jgi:dipeptidyl aminopeptidase/acylaminoacyl peptidase
MKSRNRLWIWILAALAAGFVAPAIAQKHPITHEDIWLMKRVGAPVASPDGKWVVQLVNEPAYDDGAKVVDLWLLSTDGSVPPRRLTNTPGAESDVAWSRDSTRLVFSARRAPAEKAQLFLLDLANGGEARQITALVSGARAPALSPDGRRVAFVSDVPRGTKSVDDIAKLEAERKARRHKARVYEGFPIRNWDHWLDETVPHLFVQEIEAVPRAISLPAPRSRACPDSTVVRPTTTPNSMSCGRPTDAASCSSPATIATVLRMHSPTSACSASRSTAASRRL